MWAALTEKRELIQKGGNFFPYQIYSLEGIYIFLLIFNTIITDIIRFSVTRYKYMVYPKLFKVLFTVLNSDLHVQEIVVTLQIEGIVHI